MFTAEAAWNCTYPERLLSRDRPDAVLPNKGMKLTKPGELRSFAAYPRCSADLTEGESDWTG